MADNKIEYIDYILNNGFDIKDRKIYFGFISESDDSDTPEISWRTVEDTIRKIHILEMLAPNKPIELHMHSPGGDANAMLGLIDTILSSSCQIKFIGRGIIASSAVWVMACCDERLLHANTRILIHDSPNMGENEFPIKLTDSKIEIEEDEAVQSILNKLFADNSRMPLPFWEQMVKRDLWISAEEAIMLGLADKIIEHKKRGNLRRSRISNLKKDVDKKEIRSLLAKISRRIHEGRHIKIDLRPPKEQFDSKVIVKDDDKDVIDAKTLTISFPEVEEPKIIEGQVAPKIP